MNRDEKGRFAPPTAEQLRAKEKAALKAKRVEALANLRDAEKELTRMRKLGFGVR